MDQKRVVIALAGVVAFGLAWFGSRSFFASKDATSVEALNRAASQVNKNLPMMVDKDTELVNTMGIPGKFVYSYRLPNHAAGNIDKAIFIEAATKQVTNAACSTPDTRNGFLKKGVSIRYMYSDKDRNHVATIDVTPKDCGL
jgi:hypothetical protein